MINDEGNSRSIARVASNPGGQWLIKMLQINWMSRDYHVKQDGNQECDKALHLRTRRQHALYNIRRMRIADPVTLGAEIDVVDFRERNWKRGPVAGVLRIFMPLGIALYIMSIHHSSGTFADDIRVSSLSALKSSNYSRKFLEIWYVKWGWIVGFKVGVR